MIDSLPSPAPLILAVESVLEDPSIEAHLRQFCLVLSVSLGVATLSRMFSVLRNIPYTLLLLLVGLGLALVDVRLVNLSPQLILFIFLPPLLFETAWNLNWKSLKQYAVPIMLYAIVGVVICIGSLGGGGNPLPEHPWPRRCCWPAFPQRIQCRWWRCFGNWRPFCAVAQPNPKAPSMPGI